MGFQFFSTLSALRKKAGRARGIGVALAEQQPGSRVKTENIQYLSEENVDFKERELDKSLL